MKNKFMAILLAFICYNCTQSDLDDIAQSSKTESRSQHYAFPSKAEILSGEHLSYLMNLSWYNTKKSASKNERREIGFVIYSNFLVGDYAYEIKVDKIIWGPVVKGTERANLSFGAIDYNYCGFFHTHPPLTYVSGDYSRAVGPSGKDIEFVRSYYAPGFVYDYNSQVQSGHPVNAPAHVYSFGADRRI